MTPGQHRERRPVSPARRRRLKRLVAVPVVLALATGVAWAYWSAGSLPGGNGASAATTVNQGATPTASAAASVVTVSWAPSTLSNGSAVAGYTVKRYDVATSTLQTMLSACTGLVAATTCTESSVPPGQWVYRVKPLFATNWSGADSLTSNAVTINTPPVNAITMTPLSGNAAKTGNTIFYRGVAAGSFTLTNAVTAAAGPASSATATLGGTATNWTHSPSSVSTPSGGPYVSTAFSWTAGTTSAPTEVVTSADVDTNATPTTLSMVNDSTAPTPGTINYTDGYQTARSVVVTFTTGTDGGSGLDTRRLQRAFAALTAGSCGTYSAFTNAGAVNPASPYTDTLVTGGFCYKYQYVVTDLVGNSHTATSASGAKIDYAGAVSATTGLLSQWRLGEGTASLISADSFNDTSGDLLTTQHTGEIGATWAYKAGSANTEQISNANRARRNGTGYSVNYTTATPPSPDYSVEADLFVKSDLAADMTGVIGRMSAGSETFYTARWEKTNSRWAIAEVTAGSVATLASTAALPALTVGATYRLRLSMIGTALTLYVNGVLTLSTTDAHLSAAGSAGIRDGVSGGAASKSDTEGLHYNDFQVTPATYPRAADSKGSNTGDHLNGVTLGAAGAQAGDANTSGQFDGVNDYMQAVSTTNIPVGAAARSVELWFKTSSAARQVLFNYGTPATNQEFGLWLNAGGTTMTAWGSSSDKTFTMPGGTAVNNGAWHHVVKTYDGTSITLYIDGVALAPQAATRNTVIDAYGFGIGAVISPVDTTNTGGYFNGSIDEVSLYTTALDQTSVTNHFQLGTLSVTDITGPTGGSVDASGLVGTGSRYAASTTLSLDLAKGTDPAGVAATGATLLRATATLSSAGTANGACGTYGTYTLVTGGTDPASPKTDTVTDQACYRYQYVVPDTLNNYTTYTSPDIKVDLTVGGAPALAFSTFTNTYWSGTGTTVFYRSAAATGSFRTTASATDTSSGIMSYGFPALGTNWTSTPGTQGINTYSWSGAPAAPGTKSVTAINNAAVTSSGASFTLTADDVAPTAGAVLYENALAITATISFNASSDVGGSGVGTRLLQRKSATLTGTTCGAFGAFATIVTNPVSGMSDTGVAGNCYMYQYIVADNVGNTSTATSANVLKFTTYNNVVNNAAGLVSYWRLGESVGGGYVSSDTFSGEVSDAVLKDDHVGELGATWERPGDYNDPWSDKPVLTAAGRIRKESGSTTWGVNYSSGIPASANYRVEADVYVASSLTNDVTGVMGRLSTSTVTGYAAVYSKPLGQWALYKLSSGAKTMIGTAYAQTLTPTSTYRLALDMNGTTIRLLVDGVERISVVDSTISATGTGGVTVGFQGATSTSVTDSTGMHLDNYTVGLPSIPPAADSKGTNHGTYVNAPTLGVTGGITGDSNKAVQFDGVNDYVSVARQISNDFSIEFWFKSTQGIGTGTTWWQGAGLVDADAGGTNDFGVSLRSDGKIVAGVGGTPDVSVVSTNGGYNNGAWHYVVVTRTMSNGAIGLYIDGAYAGLVIGSTASLTTPTNINFGRIQSGSGYFAGMLDDVSIYNVALTHQTIMTHYPFNPYPPP